MDLIWEHWELEEIVRGRLGVSRGRWCSVGVFRAQWGSLGLSGAQCAMYIHSIISNKYGIYELPRKLPNNLSLISGEN